MGCKETAAQGEKLDGFRIYVCFIFICTRILKLPASLRRFINAEGHFGLPIPNVCYLKINKCS